jgi:CubicO group peptidase (beta-lactamase class C family)
MPPDLKPPAPSPPAGRFAAACTVLTEAIAAHAFPGCAFGVLAGGSVVLHDALGRFTYEDTAPLVEPDTVYDIASLTKVVATTAAAMLLYQRNRLDLDMPLGELLPGFVVGRESVDRARGHARDRARHITLRHLLAHNSGLPGYVRLYQTAQTPAALFRACLALPIEADPGTRAEYSDPGFILLGKALEVITGETLASWVAREIVQPLGMTATGFCPPPADRSCIPPTEIDTAFRRRRIPGEVQDENVSVLQGVAGHAGLFSNVSNLLRFSAEILRGSARPEASTSRQPASQPPSQPPIFDSATIDLFARRQQPSGSSRALGWDTPSQPSSSGDLFSPRSIGHLGYSGCSLWIDLESAVTVVLLTNRTWPDRGNDLIRPVRPAFHNAIRNAL